MNKQYQSQQHHYKKNKYIKEHQNNQIIQTQEKQLKKIYINHEIIEQCEPEYVKLVQIKPRQHAYNVYCKVISCEIREQEKKDNLKIQIAEGQIGDETGVIDFMIIGDYTNLIKKDAIICIRNGKSEIFNEKHRLEIDRWGKVTDENQQQIQIGNINYNYDLSKIQYELKMVPKNNN